MRISVIASASAFEALAPLLGAYRERFTLRVIETQGEAPEPAMVEKWARQSDALLIVGDRRRSPRTVLPGPIIDCSDGRKVPVGWLPDTGPEQLRAFAEAAARVHRRAAFPGRRAVAVLSQWNPKYLNLADRIEALLGEACGDPAVLRWTADRLLREDVIDGLGCGLAGAIYVGHGRPIGWVGYHGMRAHHFPAGGGSPLGVMFSLCCATASRRRTGLSFCEALPLMGRAAAAFGAVEKTLHVDNTRWALGLCRAVNQGADHLGELILKAMPASPSAVTGYRILGDPLAPLAADQDAHERAMQIGVYDECLSA